MADVEMKSIDESKKKDNTEEKKLEEAKAEPQKLPPTVPEEIKTNLTLIERAVSTFEPRFTLRVLRTLAALRKRLSDATLTEAIELVYPLSTIISLSVFLYSYRTRLVDKIGFTIMVA
jgi:26S proteasome regulatory subunit N3